jgi:hypothetical protein
MNTAPAGDPEHGIVPFPPGGGSTRTPGLVRGERARKGGGMASVSVQKLEQIVGRGLNDERFRERIFSDKERLADEFGLSQDERKVLAQMDPQQFEAARRDAEREASRRPVGSVSDDELTAVVGGSFSMGTTTTAAKMILGRSIIGAQGGRYVNLTADCGCCPWKGGAVFGQLVINPG